MGGGASALQEMDEILTCTFLLGRAITAMHFPDMYRIQSFHSEKAPPLESDVMQHFSRGMLFGGGEEDMEERDTALALARDAEGDEGTNEAEDNFDYDNPSILVVVVNDERIVLDDVTKANEDGWTPLHACCHSQSTVSAGLAIIEEMKKRGGNFETKTKRGPGAGNEGWTALHMAAAYGIAPLVVCLISVGANANTLNSLSWSPLNEACHRGFIVIARELISVGKANVKHMPDVEAHRRAPFARPPPQSPLGEAARCGFEDICKLLLENGAPSNTANHVGWTPLHEACFYNHARVVKVLMAFGADACSPNGQGIYPYQLASSQEVKTILRDVIGDAAVRQQQESISNKDSPSRVGTGGEMAAAATAAAEKTPTKSPDPQQAKTPEMKKSPSLHSGAMLGELPQLPTSDSKRSVSSSQPAKRPGAVSSQRKGKAPPIPENFPTHLLCNICEQPLKDPVRSPYGGVFERKAIKTWLDRNGSVCPLTGQPLVESELKDAPDLKAEVNKFFEKPKATDNSNSAEEDLYDF